MRQDFIIPNTKVLNRLQGALGVTFNNVTYTNTGQVIVSVDPGVAVILRETLAAWKTLQEMGLDKK